MFVKKDSYRLCNYTGKAPDFTLSSFP